MDPSMRSFALPRDLGLGAALAAALGLLARCAFSGGGDGGLAALGAVCGVAALLGVARLSRGEPEIAVLWTAAVVVADVVALAALAAALEHGREVVPSSPFLLDGAGLALAVAAVSTAIALTAYRAARRSAIERIEAGQVAGWRAERTPKGVALFTERDGYREAALLVAVVPESAARRAGCVRAALVAGGLAALTATARVAEPSPWEVTALRVNAGRIVGLRILSNRFTGTGDHVCAIDDQGHGGCAGYWDGGFATAERLTVPQGARVVDIVGAHYFRTDDGRVFRRGVAPKGLAALDNRFVEQIVGYFGFGVCARIRGGAVHCVSPENPELGCSTSVPIGGDVPGLDDAVDLAGTRDTTCAARANGALRCWSNCSPTEAVALPPVRNVAGVAATGGSFCVRLRDGSVRCLEGEGWRDVPGVRAEGLVAGSSATCAWSHRELRCWAASVANERGPGPPRLVQTPEGFEQVAIGDDHLCLAIGATVRCFGRRP